MKLFEVTNNLRKSANRNTQISVIHSAHCTDLCFAICRFSQVVCHLEQLHAQPPFLFPIVFSINLIPFFDICSVLAVLSPRLFWHVLGPGLLLGPPRGRNICCLWFWQLVFGVSLWDGTSITKNAPYAWGNFHTCAITRFQKPQRLSWAGRG